MEPIELLSNEDLKAISNFSTAYAYAKPANIKKVLSYWNKNKHTLCKALGNQLRVSIPVDIKSNDKMVEQKLIHLYEQPPRINSQSDLRWARTIDSGSVFINSVCAYIYNLYIQNIIDVDTADNIIKLFSYKYIIKGNIIFLNNDSYCYKNIQTGEFINIVSGTKILKAIQKVLKFYNYDAFNLFITWRDKISDIKTCQQIKQNLVISIHPIDFMTMSDNNSGWSSCMSWERDGCYSLGTIEMMNSNMVAITYLESDIKYNPIATEDYYIPNKSWRCLLYSHKKIIVTGKQYPYTNDELALIALTFMRKLLEKNLHWKYQYKNQLYKDLYHWHSNDSLHSICGYNYNNFQRNRKYNRKPKKAIWLYTNNMYHDLIEDHSKKYWCCRNYVDKTLSLNVSGPATCMCCGEIIDTSYDDIGIKYCYKCETAYKCYDCCKIDSSINHYKIPLTNNRDIKVCKECLLDNYLYSSKYNCFLNKENELETYYVFLVYNLKQTNESLKNIIYNNYKTWSLNISEWQRKEFVDNNFAYTVYNIPKDYIKYQNNNIIEIVDLHTENRYHSYYYYKFKSGTKTAEVENLIKEIDYNFIPIKEVENIDEIISTFLDE